MKLCSSQLNPIMAKLIRDIEALGVELRSSQLNTINIRDKETLGVELN